MRILALGAHPDDVEVQCAGTLALCAQRGDVVVIATSCNGNRDNPDIAPDDMAAIRLAEGQAAARIIGAEYVCLGFSDEGLFEGEATSLRYVDLIRRTQPDLIITHAPNDYHPDHQATSALAFSASVMATVTHIQTAYPPHSLRPPIYYMDNLSGVGFEPDEFVDISPVIEIKKQMLTKHTSQFVVFERLGKDLLDWMVTAARYRGYQCGVAYAEGFRKLNTVPRLRPYRLLP